MKIAKIIISLISVACLFPATGQTQLNFTRHIVGSGIPKVVVIIPVDLNRDGATDLVGVSSIKPGGQVFWYENDGNGNFTFHLVDGFPAYGSGCYVSDLNGDTFDDIIVSITDPSGPFGNNKVVWYENDGNQNFTLHLIYTFWQPTYVFATDVDDDGDNDVLGTFWGLPDNGRVIWWENNGSGSFTTHVLHSSYRMGRSITSADFDGDGDKDIVTTGAFRYARMDWWENDGNENFTQHFMEYRVDNPQLGAYDFNNDGTLDLLYTSYLNPTANGILGWYAWQGSNPVRTVIQSTTTETGFAWASWATDLDRDGDLDVVSNNIWRNKSHYFLKSSSGYTKYVLDGNILAPAFVVAADFDSDGDMDVAIPALNEAKIYWYENLLKILVAIDIKPGSDPNSINPKRKGIIPVAILTTSTADGDPLDFDATTVDPLSVEFGPDGATEAHGKGHIEDADGDGDSDLVLHFKTLQTGIQCGDTEASLNGETFGGQPITGTDDIRTVGCKGAKAVALAEGQGAVSEGFGLYQNYPNPFNPETEIRFQIPEASNVTLKIFNLVGQEIRTLADVHYDAGYHGLRWNARDNAGNPVPSGVYLYQIRVGDFSQVRKMSLMR